MSDNQTRILNALAKKGFVLRPPEPAMDPMARMPIPGVGGGPMALAPGMNVPQPAAPMMNMRPPAMPQNDDDAWEIEDSFTPQGLAAAAGEGGRFFGDLLAPVGDAALGLGRNAINGVRQFGENLAARDSAERALSERYMPQIRAANERTSSLIDRDRALDRIEIQNVDAAESRMDALRGQLDARIAGGDPPFTARSPREPEDMDDDELIAALQSAGNIDLRNRPQVHNPDGSISTVRTIGVNIDGMETVIPTVSDDGRVMSDEEAIDQYRRTGRHFGRFRTVDEANAFAQQLHEQQGRAIQ